MATAKKTSPATPIVLAPLWASGNGGSDPLVLDVRDPCEVAAGKGGPPKVIPGSVQVPLNMDGAKQSDHLTTQSEFLAKLNAVRAALQKSAPQFTCVCGAIGIVCTFSKSESSGVRLRCPVGSNRLHYE
jgi:hypothetical protein